MTILRKIYIGYGNLMNNYSDPRTKNLFLMDSPFPTIAMSLLYIFSVKVSQLSNGRMTTWNLNIYTRFSYTQVLGPRLMANRKPLKHARTIQLLYNTVHLIINVYLLREALACGWLSFYSFTCQPVDFSNSALALRVSSCYDEIFKAFLFTQN